MTEEEAKTKWCPHVRIEGSNVAKSRTDTKHELDAPYVLGIDYIYTRDKEVYCVASGCMMWKWDGEITSCVDDSYASYRESETEGHCGLAR